MRGSEGHSPLWADAGGVVGLVAFVPSGHTNYHNVRYVWIEAVAPWGRPWHSDITGMSDMRTGPHCHIVQYVHIHVHNGHITADNHDYRHDSDIMINRTDVSDVGQVGHRRVGGVGKKS